MLGAGGATAWIFHVGVLRALANEIGFHAGEADIIVGTSAGASLAATLRAGVDLEGFYRMATRPPTSEQRREMLAELRTGRKTVIPLAAGMAKHLLPGGEGATVALAGLLPPGLFPTGWLAELPGMRDLDSWPDGLWVPAVRIPEADVVVFGRDRSDVPVHMAVEASSAVPGMFRPARIDGEVFVDGGVKTSTHADVLIDSGVDRAFISAPMVRDSGGPFARNAGRRLQEEIAVLEAAGLEVAAITPSGELSDIARGYPRRRPEAAPDIARHAARMTRLALDAA